MKECPECKRIYADDALTSCLADGSLLSRSFNLPPDTVVFSQLRRPPRRKATRLLSLWRKTNGSIIAILCLLIVAAGVVWFTLPRRETAQTVAIQLNPVEGPARPTEVFKAFYEASKNKDVASIKGLISKDILSKMEETAKKDNKSLDDYIGEQAQRGVPPSMPDTRNEKIDGDKATLEYKDPKGGYDSWRTVYFVKEDGEWKITF